MDSPFYAMLFAEDLIAYVLKKFHIEWNRTEGISPFRECIPKSRFKREIGEAVFSIIMENVDTCEKNFTSLVDQGLTTLEKYRYESSLTTAHIFENEFQPEVYLNMCAALTAHAWQSFLNLKLEQAREIASVSAQILAFIINFYIYKGEFNPFTDWFFLVINAQKVRRRIAKMRKETAELSDGKC